ncbi:hypothetical protein J2802_005078 [Paraburkholderia caribensis]|jgi:hypothetical protein|nr:hypothetical protein [Paraburkholderia caribensis]
MSLVDIEQTHHMTGQREAATEERAHGASARECGLHGALLRTT